MNFLSPIQVLNRFESQNSVWIPCLPIQVSEPIYAPKFFTNSLPPHPNFRTAQPTKFLFEFLVFASQSYGSFTDFTVLHKSWSPSLRNTLKCFVLISNYFSEHPLLKPVLWKKQIVIYTRRRKFSEFMCIWTCSVPGIYGIEKQLLHLVAFLPLSIAGLVRSC